MATCLRAAHSKSTYPLIKETRLDGALLASVPARQQGLLSCASLTQQRCVRGRSEGAGVATVGMVGMAAASTHVADMAAMQDRRTQARRFPHVTLPYSGGDLHTLLAPDSHV